MEEEELVQAFERFISIGGGSSVTRDMLAPDDQEEEISLFPLHLPEKLKDPKLREGIAFDAAELENQISKGWKMAEQAKAQSHVFDLAFERQMGTFSRLEKLHEEMEKLRLDLYNLQKDCHSLFKIKMERETAAQQARSEASQLIWSKVKTLHAALAQERGFTVAAAVVEVVVEFLRFQNASCLVEQVKGLPETQEGLLALASGKSVLAERIQAVLRQNRNVDISGQANVLNDTNATVGGSDGKYKPPGKYRAKQQDQENAAKGDAEDAGREVGLAAVGGASPPGFARAHGRRPQVGSPAQRIGSAAQMTWQQRPSADLGGGRSVTSAGARRQ